MKRQGDYLLFAEKLKNSGLDVLFMKYEEFEGNIDFILKSIEKKFDISVDDADRDLLINGYSKENISLAVEGFDTFQKYFPVSGFHGKHVALEKYEPPAELLFWLHSYIYEVEPVFKKYGYFQE